MRVTGSCELHEAGHCMEQKDHQALGSGPRGGNCHRPPGFSHGHTMEESPNHRVMLGAQSYIAHACRIAAPDLGPLALPLTCVRRFRLMFAIDAPHLQFSPFLFRTVPMAFPICATCSTTESEPQWHLSSIEIDVPAFSGASGCHI